MNVILNENNEETKNKNHHGVCAIILWYLVIKKQPVLFYRRKMHVFIVVRGTLNYLYSYRALTTKEI